MSTDRFKMKVKRCPDKDCGGEEEPHVWRDPEDNKLKQCEGGPSDGN